MRTIKRKSKRKFGKYRKKSKRKYVPGSIYQDILNILGEWKVLNLQQFQELYYGEISYHNLFQKMKTLEKYQFVRSALVRGKSKYFFLTGRGRKYSKFRGSEEVFERELSHDLITANVLRKFLKWESCLDGKILHQSEGGELCPDAEMTILTGGKKVKVALEVELSRKDRRRVLRKFNRYGREKEFDMVLFVTHHEGIFRGYRNYLTDTGESVQRKIAILLDANLSMENFDYKNSRCFFGGKETNFFSIFGADLDLNSIKTPLRPDSIPP